MRKLLFLFLLIGLSNFMLGQELLSQKINFQTTEKPIDQTLDQLADQTGIDIAYSKSFFRNTPPVSVSAEQESIRQILDKILIGTNIQYKTLGENRVLLFKEKIKFITLTGYVEDQETGERIVGARVFSKAHNIGAITNEYGFYSMRLPEGKTSLLVRSIGFKANLQHFNFKDEKQVTFVLEPVENLPEVVVDAASEDMLGFSSIATDQDNITEISPRLAGSIPSLNGQPDYVRVAQILPGIKGQSDGFGGINIRGGESGQNLMLMDGTPVYIPYHLLGLYSTYNPETVKSVKVVKGNFPSRYGGAVSSVLDVRIREGDLYKWKGNAEINLLNGGLCIEGPIKKGKGSILLAGRFSPNAYFFKPVLTRLYFQKRADELETNFHDFNIKSNYSFSKRDRLYMSIFSGSDLIRQQDLTNEDEYSSKFTSFDLKWRNTVGSLRWNHLFSKSLFLNTTLTYSNYGYEFSTQNDILRVYPESNNYELFVIDSRSSNIDMGFKMDFDAQISNKHKFRFGLQHNYRNFKPQFYFYRETVINASEQPELEPYNFISHYDSLHFPIYQIAESAVYFEDHVKVNRFYINWGARLTSFIHEESQFFNIEPRILVKQLLNEKMTLSLALNRRMQYLHLIANPSLQLPTDLWLPSSNQLKPQELYEAELAFQYRPIKYLKINTTAYYRRTNNLYSYPENITILFETNDYTNYDYLENGKGKSKGIELFADYADEKRGVLFTYTLSKTTRQFDSINLGNSFASNFDSRHQITLAYHQNISSKFKFGATWIFNSPTPKVNIIQLSSDGNNPIIGEDPPGQKNQTRGTVYNRIDLNFQFNHIGKKMQHTIKFGVYNMLNTRNVAFYEITNVDAAGNIIATAPLYSLPIQPSFSYRIGF